MLLGITDSEDQMAEMFDVAQRLALAVGQDATFGIESLVTGLGRQSKLMLDNLGIMVDTNKAYDDYADEIGTTVDKLTDQERKQAFVNAAMKEANTLVKGLGKENLTTKQKLDKFTTSISNFKAEVGEALIESGVLAELTKYSTMLINFAKNTFELGKEEETLAEKADRFTASIKTQKSDLENLKVARGHLVRVTQNQNEEEVKWFQFWKDKPKTVRDVTQSEKELQKLEESRLYVSMLQEQQNMSSVEWLKAVQKEIKSNTAWLASEEAQLESIIKKKEKQEELEKENQVSAIDRLAQDKKSHKSKLKMKAEEFAADMKKLTFEKDASKIATTIGKNAIKFGKMNALQAWQTEMTMAVVNAAAAIIKASKGGNIAAGLVMAAQMAPQVSTIAANKPKAQTGFEGVIDEPTQFTVGEGGAAEYVSVTPMEGVNNASKGQGININITGNVMSEQFVEEELAERISEAVRKGVNFGIV